MAAMINGLELTAGEAAAFGKAAGKARIAYKRKHGTHAVAVPDAYRIGNPGTGATAEWRDDAARLEVSAELATRVEAWELTHRASYDAAAYRAGVSAVKRMHTRYAEDERHAVAARARLAELGLAGRTRKAAAPKPAAPAVEVVEVPAPVVEAPAEDVAPVVPIRPELEPVAAVAAVDVPATVPAPMPAMTRAARRASNRELAERMRAAGLAPAGDAWRLAVSGVPLEDIAAAVSALEVSR